MKILGVVAGVLLATTCILAAPAGAEQPRGRFDARTTRLLVEDRLARQGAMSTAQIEYSTPYLPRVGEDRSVDVQIRRLGELIRQREQEEQKR